MYANTNWLFIHICSWSALNTAETEGVLQKKLLQLDFTQVKVS